MEKMFFLCFWCCLLIAQENQTSQARLLLWSQDVVCLRGEREVPLSGKDPIPLAPGDQVVTERSGCAVIGYTLSEKQGTRYFSVVLSARSAHRVSFPSEIQGKRDASDSPPPPFVKSVSPKGYRWMEGYSRIYRLLPFAGIEPGEQYRKGDRFSVCFFPQGEIASLSPVFSVAALPGGPLVKVFLTDAKAGQSLSLHLDGEETLDTLEGNLCLRRFSLPPEQSLLYDRSYVASVKEEGQDSPVFSCRFATFPEPLARRFRENSPPGWRELRQEIARLRQSGEELALAERLLELARHYAGWREEWEEEVYDARGEARLVRDEAKIILFRAWKSKDREE